MDRPAGAWGRLRRSEALLAGLAAMVLATALLGLAALAVGGFPFPPLGLAQRLLRLIPGAISVFFVERLGHWALRLFTGGFMVGSLLAGAFAGVLVASRVTAPAPGRWAWLTRSRAVWLAAAVLGAVALGGYGEQPGGPSFLVYAVVVGIAAVVYAVTLRGALDRLERDPVPPPARGVGRLRRELLRAAIGGAGLLVLGLAARRLTLGFGDRGGEPLVRPAGAAPLEPPPPPEPAKAGDAAFAAIDGLTPEVTPNRKHYVVDESIIDPDVDSGSWRLRVDGLVGRPVELSYHDLLVMPAIEQYVTMQCISNYVGGHLVGTAKWTGVPLEALLERAGGAGDGAFRVVFHAVGGYTDSLPVAKALDPQTIVAYGMNGRTLPRSHGYPARIIVPGIYGMKNVKWLERIEVVNYDYEGYWQRGGRWANVAPVKTASRIDTPTELDPVGESAVIAGVAWAGDRGIRSVEVSVDGGRTWVPARLRRELAGAAWRQWLLDWRPARSGKARVLVRATDGRGRLQTAADAAPYPSGSTGYDRIDLIVEGP